MKTCNHPTCSDTCRRIKKPKKPLNKLKRTPIKKISKKQTKRLGEQKVVTTKDREFFLEVWENREHRCYETGEPLYEPLTLYFHHVLKSRKFDRFRRCDWNILLLGWSHHTNSDSGAMVHTPKVKQYFNYLNKHLEEIDAGTYIPSMEKFKKETT